MRFPMNLGCRLGRDYVVGGHLVGNGAMLSCSGTRYQCGCGSVGR